MLTVAISGEDTIQIVSGLNTFVCSTLANQDPGKLTLPNELGTVDVGKTGGVIYAENLQGMIADLTLRLILLGIDDQSLNAILQTQLASFADFTLLAANFVKRVGDGQGNITTLTYQLEGGFVHKGVETLTAAQGNTEETVAVWNLRFGSWTRTIT